jgi:hypothetical protein
MEKLLSIVIPVYKVEKYIDKCISSLLVPDEKQLDLLDIVVMAVHGTTALNSQSVSTSFTSTPMSGSTPTNCPS